MSLNSLQITDVRNLERVFLPELNNVNVFYGNNGTGKTTLLESIHLLGMARSFRAGSFKSFIRHGRSACVVYGEISLKDGTGVIPVGVKRATTGEAKIKVAGQVVRTLAELAELFPIQVINADSFNLLTGSPSARRQFLDWGVFHVEHSFFEHWQKFQRCIKQRNKLLRHGKISELELGVWTRDLAISGRVINELRKKYFDELTPKFESHIQTLMPSLQGVQLHYRQGWDKHLSYDEALASSRVSDVDQGYTHVGPQRADIRVTIDGYPAADTLSRGQQKLVICALKLAQGTLIQLSGRTGCTYLVDDLPSELDPVHCKRVCKVLAELEAQVFITCVQKQEIASVWKSDSQIRMFHVEHGRVSPEPVATE